MISYSQNSLDIKLLEYVNYKNGVFVECGANDGITASNSYLFETTLNWSGLLVEPTFENYIKCKELRSNSIVENYALVSFDYEKHNSTISGDFIYSEDNVNGLMSGISGVEKYYQPTIESKNIKVPCISLHNLILKHNIKSIDLFSLDVEGYELEVLNGVDFSYIRPKYILIETANILKYQELIRTFMETKNYVFLTQLSGNDDLFVDSFLI
jgi:FkbM family methyltransferase